MKPHTAVIVATRGRPQDVSNLLSALGQQTILADTVIVSACDHSDIEQNKIAAEKIEVLFGPPGLAAQRNRALSSVRGKFDLIIFFDDDFIPSRFWIERIQELFAVYPDIVCATGHVILDGVTIGALEARYGQTVVDDADLKAKRAIKDCKVVDRHSPYGCNMAFLAKSIDHLTFDERLVLYGWLEDRDFAFRAGANGRMIWTDAVWGVHLGTRRGRVPGLRFGYSQVVNPWYLMKKGSMTRFDVYRMILRGFAGNALRSFFPDPRVDRWGRLKGNIIGIKDIIFARWAPERIINL